MNEHSTPSESERCNATGSFDPDHRHRGHVVPGSPDPSEARLEGAGAAPLATVGGVELALARLLRVGVFASLILIGLGLAVALMQGIPPIESRDVRPISLGGIARGVRAVRGEAIIDLGLLVLIATPVLRVFAAFILFTRLRDRAFTWLTLSVLVILIGSFLAGRIDGERTEASRDATSHAADPVPHVPQPNVNP